jgi:hypothetical protein
LTPSWLAYLRQSWTGLRLIDEIWLVMAQLVVNFLMTDEMEKIELRIEIGLQPTIYWAERRLSKTNELDVYAPFVVTGIVALFLGYPVNFAEKTKFSIIDNRECP